MLGLRHGEGVLTFANGASYSGRWEFDKVIHLTDQTVFNLSQIKTTYSLATI